MKKKLILALLALVVLGGFGYYRKTAASQAAVRYVTAAAAKGTLISSVSGSGNIVVDQTARVNPGISGTVTGLAVSLGDQVKRGQTLFTIVNDQLDVTVDKSYSSYLQAKQALLAAQAQLTTAQATYTNQSQDSGQAKAQAGLDQATQQLSAAQAQLSQDQQILSATASTEATYATLQSKVSLDQGAVAADQDGLTAASIALQQAKVSGTAGAQSAGQQLEAARQGVETAQKNVEAALADYDNQQAAAALRTVAAPIDGTITTLSVGNGDQLGGTSAASASAAPVVIADLSTLKVSIEVNEVDAPKVQPGQKASMTFDAIDGLTLTGKVEKIDTVGTVTQGVVTYAAVIDLDSLDKRVRPQMSASAVITTDVKQDVLTVPNAAVKSQNGESYVQIMRSGLPAQQTVQVGATNDTDTEITSGLSEGDQVVTQTITPAASKAASTSKPAAGIPGLGGGGVTRIGSGGRGN